jgi:DNA-binding transcriptional ArsR family regulator
MTNSNQAFNALGSPTRRTIFERLSKGPLAVVDIAEKLPVTRPAISQHLKVLMQAGLVTVHQQGTRRLYEIDPKGVMAMRNYLDSMWDTALHAFKTAAENERKKEK